MRHYRARPCHGSGKGTGRRIGDCLGARRWPFRPWSLDKTKHTPTGWSFITYRPEADALITVLEAQHGWIILSGAESLAGGNETDRGNLQVYERISKARIVRIKSADSPGGCISPE